MAKKLKILNVGDVHLGHRETSTSHIIENLTSCILKKEVLADIDLLTVAGDFFDTQISYDDPRIGEIEAFISRLLWECASNDVIVRVLKGTPSHDWNQSSFFERQKEMARVPVDIKYIDKLSIEFIEPLGITMLYVPDKWNPTSTEDTFNQITKLMRDNGLKRIDFALMHGAFEFQLPDIVEEPTHDSDAFLEIIKHLIFIGHVHVRHFKERIIGSGAFDRLNHGEEGPKGFTIAEVNLDTGDFTNVFVENKNAKIYKTIDLKQATPAEVWNVAKELMGTYPPGSAFRLVTSSDESLSNEIIQIQKAYRNYEWKINIERSKKEKTERMSRALGEVMEKLPDLTPDVIETIVVQILSEKDVPEERMPELISILREGINDCLN